MRATVLGLGRFDCGKVVIAFTAMLPTQLLAGTWVEIWGLRRLVRCSAAPLLLHDDRRADLDSVIEIDHVLIGQANAAR
jgi:hypothetical protein